MAYWHMIRGDLIAVRLCSSCLGGKEIWGHITREWWGRGLLKNVLHEQRGKSPQNDGKIKNNETRQGGGKEEGGDQKEREQEKPHQTIFLPRECNTVMKEEGGPHARGPLIKLSEQGVREGANERKWGLEEEREWRTEINGTAQRTPIKNKTVIMWREKKENQIAPSSTGGGTEHVRASSCAFRPAVHTRECCLAL